MGSCVLFLFTSNRTILYNMPVPFSALSGVVLKVAQTWKFGSPMQTPSAPSAIVFSNDGVLGYLRATSTAASVRGGFFYCDA